MSSDTEQHKQVDTEDGDDFRSDLCSLLSRFDREDVSDTPDWILRDYMWNCLRAFETATYAREKFYGNRYDPKSEGEDL